MMGAKLGSVAGVGRGVEQLRVGAISTQRSWPVRSVEVWPEAVNS